MKNTVTINKLNKIVVNTVTCKEFNPNKSSLDKTHTNATNMKDTYDNERTFLKQFLKLSSLDNIYPIKINTNAIKNRKV